MKILHPEDMHGYQDGAVSHIMNNDFAGVFLDMGLGKTVSTLTAIKKLIYEELDVCSVLVIAPKKVVENVWTDEVKTWSHLSGLSISLVLGNPRQRHEALNVKADIHVISRDSVTWLTGLYGGSMLPFDMLVIDESSSFKNPKSQRFKALRKAQPSFKRVVILTGTPAPNGLQDLWSQIFLLDRGERLGRTLTQYRESYFRPDKTNGSIVYSYKTRADSEETIHNKIKDICISMKAEDYLDMPDKIMITKKVTFSEKVRRQYDEFEKEQVLSFSEEEEVSALSAAALSNKLLQFANGAVYDEDRNVIDIHDEKIEALEELVEEANGRPILVAWSFKHDEAKIHKAFKKIGARAYKTSQDKEDWNNGLIPLLTMHPASGGHGLNLQAGGNIIVWFGPNWSLELYQQLNARLYRQGQQSKTVTTYHIIAAGTLDGDVLASLDRKDVKQEGLMQAIKARIKKYGGNRK